MASGKIHDKAILYLSPLAIGLGYSFSSETIVPFTIAYAVGGLVLSPDIDLKHSNPSNRMLFSFLWQPYRNLSGHRGFSHWIAIGTLSRMLYVAMLIFVPFLIWANYADITASDFPRFPVLLSALAPIFWGLEASALVHLAFDYVPVLNKLR